MLYVERIEFRNRRTHPFATVCVPYLYYTDFYRTECDLFIRLHDTEDDTLKTLSNRLYLEFEHELRELLPYGWTPGGYYFYEGMFTVIDKISLDFLSCVEDVDILPEESVQFRVLAHQLKHEFSVWDGQKTILDASTSFEYHSFPLFQVIVFTDEGWRGDEYFFKSRGSSLVYRVRFSNINKARAMISKAVILGYNPILANKNIVPHLFR